MIGELRADGLHIEGYVNIPGRESRPVQTPRGRVNEISEPRAFATALEEAPDVQMLLDHDRSRVLAARSAGTLELSEDAVGLRAKSVITDEEVIEYAKRGELRGWSFNIRNPEDSVEERAGRLPLRRVKKFSMDEISLIVHKVPVYSATIVEVRAGSDEEDEIEYRGTGEDFTFRDMREPEKDVKLPENKPDDIDYNQIYQTRIDALKL